MAVERLNREEFFAKLAPMDEAELRKTLWTLYWRGTAPVRERIEALLDPPSDAGVRAGREAAALPDAAAVLAQVREFAALARRGGYLGRDRRVSPKERSRWRFTFRNHAVRSVEALRGEDIESAGAAVAIMVDLACETRGYDYFRSEDPVEAARFVVSDAIAELWTQMQRTYGVDGLIERAVGQLVRWESRYGWSRRGEGWVSQHETSLANVLARLLVAPESWTAAARRYLDELDRFGGRGRQQRAEDLAEWNALLIDRLLGSDGEELLDRLVAHPALAGRQAAVLRAHLMMRRGESDDG
ncbi:MAG: hypothetical protein KDB63_20900 [Nocardioidaceae bacterium]|nr:hypothetical protein [Nocardioidaceae bacterium]